MIKEFKIADWNNELLDNGKVVYPQSNDTNAPRN